MGQSQRLVQRDPFRLDAAANCRGGGSAPGLAARAHGNRSLSLRSAFGCIATRTRRPPYLTRVITKVLLASTMAAAAMAAAETAARQDGQRAETCDTESAAAHRGSARRRAAGPRPIGARGSRREGSAGLLFA
ncbi:hypothetical protein PHYSODRAFT_328245 [Phytophthora sojae]|uniref:Uncharacterized protein n=1 Tax=Phytophthora sojae (strain P6497) TaxID=1094619 RepID=G4Z3M2_PHYSP|nr:hypothetical protein PHYSODRAFT_328245 [Phytophthora sojae]EGZ20091.1 hypothetical protein PHYSODRAFT_328245 [Phytophthora sojae]|eukprot:XP_009522808.1 hypothetical protein PHYSODRAFT_328245 [Phytophthora sojae]